MYSLISIKIFAFSLVVVEKSNVDINEKEIIDNQEIMELEMKPNSMVIKLDKNDNNNNNNKNIAKIPEINDNDEIIIKGKTYIVLHKIKH